MSVIVERSIFTHGTLVRVRAIQSSGDAVKFHGSVGIIIRTPLSPGCLYEVSVGDQFVWLTQSEMDIVRENYKILS